MRIKQNSLIAGILVSGMGMVVPENALSSTSVLIKDLVQFLQSETDFVTSHSPHSAIVKILVRTNDSRIECTGSVISRNKVLTAAHCVRDGKIGRWIGEAITVIPGLDGWHEGNCSPDLGSRMNNSQATMRFGSARTGQEASSSRR